MASLGVADEHGSPEVHSPAGSEGSEIATVFD